MGRKSIVLSNVFMICHSKLQVRRILLMLVSLPIKTLLGVVFSDQSGVCHISGLIIGQNDWLCIRSYLTTLQITWNLMVINPHLCWDILSYQYLPLKVQRRSSHSVLMRQNQSAQISAQLFLFARVCFFFMKDKIFIVYLIFRSFLYFIVKWEKKGLFLPDWITITCNYTFLMSEVIFPEVFYVVLSVISVSVLALM